ncbi:MAG: guanylate kinase [Anaerolineae bacterium]
MEETLIRDPYHPPHYPLLIVISGPSGVGKDSVVRALQAREHPFHFVVTTTSRPQRPGEVHGVDYYFVSEARFEEMIANDELLEHALVYGQHKGVHKKRIREALESGQDVVMRLDVQGAMTVKRLVPDAVLIFLNAESKEELRRRLRKRGTEAEEEITRRLQKIQEEMGYLEQFDYLVLNRRGQLKAAVDQVMAIVRSEHCRVHPRRVTL